MYILSGDLMQYHEQRVKELSSQYQSSLWQQDRIKNSLSTLNSQIRSWFDSGVETVSGTDSRMEPQTAHQNNR